MNVIEIDTASVLTYEIIYRDPAMTRHLSILDDSGNVLHHHKL